MRLFPPSLLYSFTQCYMGLRSRLSNVMSYCVVESEILLVGQI